MLHISSLPGCGVGGLGKYAFDFADKLKKAGFGYWQMLPVNPTSPSSGNSPYSSVSLFAGNRYFIDLEEFVNNGWLDKDDLALKPQEFVNFDQVDRHRRRVLKKAYLAADEKTVNKAEVWAMSHKNIYIYALYSAIKDCFKKPWNEWPTDLKEFKLQAAEDFAQKHKPQIRQYLFEQYFFFKQFAELKAYANKNGIEIVGDFPVYASFDSADVWANQNLFELENFEVKLCAGVPPDYFSATGQLWGNPVYKIAEHKKDGYRWMTDRFRTAAMLFDVLRVDHFRGYESFWAVPAGQKDAVNGSWKEGFGVDLFKTVEKQVGIEIIAEDLGIITDEVNALKDGLGYPGMNVLQFAYCEENSRYLPQNSVKNSVSYIGTHDNDTLAGWLDKACGYEMENIKKKTGYDGDIKVFFDELWSANSDVVIVAMQDMLSLGSKYRMNVPSVAQGNWTYQMKNGQFDDEKVAYFAALNLKNGR